MIQIAAIVLLLTLLGALVLYVMAKRAERKEESAVGPVLATRAELTPMKKGRQYWNNVLQQSYIRAVRLPFLQGYVMKIRKRLSTLQSYDEYTMRRETMRITFLALGGLGIGTIVLILLTRDWTYFFFIVITALIINGSLIDVFVNRVEDRLLYQQTESMADIRHYFHQHGMVDEAIYEAAEIAPYEISLHLKKIHEILTSNNPQEQLDAYYEVAPNRYLKIFAGISYLVKEYGDRVLEKGSMFLNSLNRLKNDIFTEILRRKKLSYKLKGLSAMAVIPIFFIKPIENWASNYFPLLADYYVSKIGFLTKVLIFLVVLVSYTLLRKMQENDDIRYVAQISKHRWKKALYQKAYVKWIVDRFVPAKNTKDFFKMTKLLKDTNSTLTVEWFTMNRLIYFILATITALSIFIYQHSAEINRTLNANMTPLTMFGKPTAEEALAIEQTNDFDREVIKQLKGVTANLSDRIAAIVNEASDGDADPSEITAAVARIAAKVDAINSEYLKWWEVVISLAAGFTAYFAPLWILNFQRRLREMEMKLEVDQMHTIIAMLSENERASVEMTLEWMERYAIIFKQPLKTCLLNYESGAYAALEELKIDAPFTPFVRTVERLQNALERVPLKEAFDDLETDRNFYQEERKQENEKTIDGKSSWGNILGFAPMMSIVMLYLVVPFIVTSVMNMNTYYKQIQMIS
ncbi:hypothetical protein [Paenibacillus rubinfantis]|uniref:hypothetical protein n=1 Tax=Paenibacillus rubinfantis TaxID=1720296 RepID=UPI00073E46FA|nr:hypothetical protein [Paenibacillus rubinfantis]